MAVEEPALALHEVVVVRGRDRHDVGEESLLHRVTARRSSGKPVASGDERATRAVGADHACDRRRRSSSPSRRAPRSTRGPRRVPVRGRGFRGCSSCSMRSAATIVSWSGAHSSVRTRATRRCTGSSSGAPSRRVPRWSTAQLAPPVGKVEPRCRGDRRVRRRGRRGACSSRGRRRARGDPRTRRGSPAPRRGRARAARARDLADRRRPPPAAVRSRRGRAGHLRTADSTPRTGHRPTRLARRFPPACSRARRRRHMSSARRNIAGVTTRGKLAPRPSTLRTRNREAETSAAVAGSAEQ